MKKSRNSPAARVINGNDVTGPTTSSQDWLSHNAARLRARTAFLADLPPGEVLSLPGSMHHLRVVHYRKQLRLYFRGHDSPLIQSRIRVDGPLHLLAPYAQAMMLVLLLQPNPRRIYMIGFGAGRLPMVLHHHFPQAIVDCTEIDLDVLAVAQSHFGVELDHRLRVTIMDGRAYLEGLAVPGSYETIFVNVSDGTDSSPIELASSDFYALCKRHLAEHGVVAVNLLHCDARYHEKVSILRASFRTLYAIKTTVGGTVFIAVDGSPITVEVLVSRARLLARRHRFAFPFVKHALRLLVNPTLAQTV